MATGSQLTLRCKTKCGQHVLKSLTSDSTIDELKVMVESLTSIPSRLMRIKIGYPPKAVEDCDGSKILSALQIRSGDTVVIDERENNGIRASQEKKKDQMVRIVVPADNSCLFTSMNYVMEGRLDPDSSTALRELIATIVMSDPETYNEAYLNQSNADYRRWITLQDSWGGAIEVAILSKYYGVEVCVVDTQTVRIDRFGEDQNYAQRVFLIYDGIHYDALALETVDNGTRTQFFNVEDEDHIFGLALELAGDANAKRQFTDVHKFSLRCLICQKALKGQTEAQAHAKDTGHINFGEY